MHLMYKNVKDVFLCFKDFFFLNKECGKHKRKHEIRPYSDGQGQETKELSNEIHRVRIFIILLRFAEHQSIFYFFLCIIFELMMIFNLNNMSRMR